MIARHIIFKGNVQGVGFRYRVYRAASGYNVTGYVKNLADGTVEMLIEGDKHNIDAVLEAIHYAMGSHIRKELINTRPPTLRYTSFKIAY
ncbi:MAG: acylphosphatase [Phycisphaerae bacterium]|nr:acylphosphatase [Phycisphaerae bacterium]